MIVERIVGDVVVLDVDGSLSATLHERPLRAAVRRFIQRGRTRILINMRAVPYIDSTGLADLVEVIHAVRRADGVLKVADLTARVRELLQVTMLLTVVEAYPSETDALASFGVPAA